MSNEKKLLSRLERRMARLPGGEHNGELRPDPAVPEPAGPGAIIDPHSVVPGWTWETDAQGRYTTCSPEIAAQLGFDPAALIGQPLTHIALPAANANWRELTSALRAQRPLLDLRLEARAPDGSDRVVIFNGMPRFDAAGYFQGFRGVAHVISEMTDLPPLARPAPRVAISPQAEPLAATMLPPEPPPATAPTPSDSVSPAFAPEARPTAATQLSPAIPLWPAPLAASTTPPNSKAPTVPASSRPLSWGYLANADGLAPLGEWTAPEVDEALAKGALVVRGAVAEAGSAAAAVAAGQAVASRSLAVPIQLQNQTIGVLDFFDDGGASAWSEDDLALVKAVTDQLALALENARLFDETRTLLEEITRERERLSVLYDMLQGLITRPDRQAVYETALHMAPRLGAQHAYLLVLGEREADANFLSTLPGLEHLDARQANAYALTIASQGLERGVLETGRSVVVPDTRLDARWNSAPQHVQQAAARAVISVALQTQRGSLRGVLAYTHSMPGALGEEHLPLIESIARQVAVALENEQLRQLQSTQSEHAQSLARAAQAMTRTLNEAELHQIIVEQVFTAFNANGVVLLRWVPSNNTFLPVAVEVLERETLDLADRQSWPVLGQAFSANERLDLLDSVENRRGRIVPLREEPGGQLRESMAMPLYYGGDVEGVVEVVHTGQIGGLGQAELELLQSILTAAASALQSARLYELQRQTAERLAEVDRLKSQFLANMSHELRTPLNSIIGFSRVILKGIDGPLTDLQGQDLTSINNAGQHLLGLINDILDMARIEAGKMELVLDEVDLHDTINGVMSTTVALVKDKPVRLVQDVAPNLPRVRADSMRVRQVLLNLLANAAKFTDSGTISLRARAVEEVGPYSGRQEPFVEIAIIDTGTGIAPEDMVKLFEPFSQVDASATRKVGGTGLGLSICRQLVELHNGRIWAESEFGKGSRFIFILPVSQPEPAEPEPPEATISTNDRVVLAVDDDPGLVGLYRRYLEPHGYRVVGVNRSSEAITRAAELRPIVVLLDVLMPNKDGWQVLTELKRSDLTRDIPVIMCTLITEPERAQELGAADYLTKPILEGDLLQALRRLPAAAPAAVPGNGHAAEQRAGKDQAN